MQLKLNKTKPPKNREFIGIVENGKYPEFFNWGGHNRIKCFLDRNFYEMPKIIGWIDIPEFLE